jgi:hypothetical protein
LGGGLERIESGGGKKKKGGGTVAREVYESGESLKLGIGVSRVEQLDKGRQSSGLIQRLLDFGCTNGKENGRPTSAREI